MELLISEDIKLLCEELNCRIERTWDRYMFVYNVNIKDIIRLLNEGKCAQFIILLEFTSNDVNVCWTSLEAYIHTIYASRLVELSLYSDLIKTFIKTAKNICTVQITYCELIRLPKSIKEVKALMDIFLTSTNVIYDNNGHILHNGYILYQLIYESNIDGDLLHSCAAFLSSYCYDPQLVNELIELLKMKLSL